MAVATFMINKRENKQVYITAIKGVNVIVEIAVVSSTKENKTNATKEEELTAGARTHETADATKEEEPIVGARTHETADAILLKMHIAYHLSIREVRGTIKKY